MNFEPYLRSAALGATAGLRTFTPAVALRRRSHGPGTLALAAGALGELIGDKLPFTPSRLSPPALFARIAAGATAGSTVASRTHRSRAGAALAGAAGALAGAYIGYHLRRAVVQRTKLPDAAVAVFEDAIAIGVALALSRGL